jgi:hypothetical protein
VARLQEPYSPTSFNPFANGRFAAGTADPPRAMFYTGETSDCALWETVLRDVFPQSRPPHGVELPPLSGYHIARVRLKRDVEILDLGRASVRWIAGDDLKRRDRIMVLTAVPKYTATHNEAAKLLSEFPRTAGLLWPSKQTGEDGTIPGLGSCAREGSGEDGGADQAALEPHQVAECGEGRRREEAYPCDARPHKCQRQACDGVRPPGRGEVGVALAAVV